MTRPSLDSFVGKKPDLSTFVKAPPTSTPLNEFQSGGALNPIGKITSQAAQDVSSGLQKRSTQAGDAIERGLAGKQSIGSTALQVLGSGAGLGVDIFGAGIKGVFSALGELNPGIKDAVHTGIEKFTQLPAVQQGIQEAKKGADAYGAWAQKNPTESANLESVFNIASMFPIVKAGGQAINAAKTAIPEAASALKTMATDIPGAIRSAIAPTEEKLLKQTWDVIKPNLTTTERAQAVTEGKIISKGVLKTIEQVPKGRDVDMIKAAQPYVSESKTPLEAVAKMQQGIQEHATALKEGLDKTGAIYNANEIKSVVSAIQKPVLISSDATLDRAYDLVKRKMLELTGKGGKLGDLLQARKDFDAFVSKQFPNLYNSDTLTPMRKAIADIRGAINDVIDSRLPDGTLPNGTNFRESLKSQSLLYDAIENTAPKVPEIGSNIVTRAEKAIRKHPVVTTAAAGAAAVGAGKALGL